MSQLHRRVIHGYDVNGDTPFSMGDSAIAHKAFTEDAAEQSVDFKTLYFPTGTDFALADIPAGMALNASTGVLDGTPTTVSSAETTLTVTYTSPAGTQVRAMKWSWAVGASDVNTVAGAFVDAVEDSYDFGALFPGAVNFSIVDGPSGMTLDQATGVLSGTPDTVATDTATLSVYYPSSQTRDVPWAWEVAAA